MNDDEIMKKFNETFSNDLTEKKEDAENVAPYKATTNFNTPNNVEQSVGGVQDLDKEKPDINSLLSQDPSSNSGTYYNSNVDYNKAQPEQYSDNVSYNYIPTYTNNQKEKKLSISITPEMKLLLGIVALLFIFILVIPTIYDFIRQIKMR